LSTWAQWFDSATLAQALGTGEAAELLEETLTEEKTPTPR
jgi:ferritin-like metal-binding protein YciE